MAIGCAMISMLDVTLPLFRQNLRNLSTWIEKTEALALANKWDPQGFVEARLAPDMLPFKNQIRIVCDGAKFCVARLAGVEAPKHEDNESTLPELRARIASCLAFLDSITAEQIKGSDDRKIMVPVRGTPTEMTGHAMVMDRALPNFYFHLTTAYALLRHNGVQIGKSDFLHKS
jgi:uncharacterized protein